VTTTASETTPFDDATAVETNDDSTVDRARARRRRAREARARNESESRVGNRTS
jgi:hypothetical protein